MPRCHTLHFRNLLFDERPPSHTQMGLFAEEERDDLPLVNVLREDVRRWRESGWANGSQVTKTLLRHWWRDDRGRRLFFCQLEAVETIIYLREILALGKQVQVEI
jgi:type III restriction enzyme